MKLLICVVWLKQTLNANVSKSDYAFGIKVKHIMPGLEFGFARTHDKSQDSNRGLSNDKFFASYKAMPNLGVFYTTEEVEIATTVANAGTSKLLVISQLWVFTTLWATT